MAGARWTSEQLEQHKDRKTKKPQANAVPIKPETKEQQGLIGVFKLRWPKIYETGALFAVPNEGKRDPKNSSRMIAEGLLSNVSDLILLWPVGNYHGACVEMKAKNGKPSKGQLTWLAERKASGYATAVCYGMEEGLQFFDNYINNRLKE